jgi:hypothetical protein
MAWVKYQLNIFTTIININEYYSYNTQLRSQQEEKQEERGAHHTLQAK